MSDDIMVAELRKLKAETEQELAKLVAQKLAGFRSMTGQHIRAVDVDMVDVSTQGGPPEYIVAGVRCDVDL